MRAPPRAARRACARNAPARARWSFAPCARPRRVPARAPLTVRVLGGRSKLWHQATLAVEELAKDPCFSAEGNKDLLTLYDELVKDQPPSAPWSGFGSRMNSVKHAGACVRTRRVARVSASARAWPVSRACPRALLPASLTE